MNKSKEEQIPHLSPSTFPKPGTVLYKLISDPEFRGTFRARVRQGNRWIVPLYRLGILPLLGFSKQVMLLSTKGRKSQKMRDTPIGYYRIGGTITLFSSWGKNADWYKNMLACPEEVFIQVGFHRQRAIPEIVEDPEEFLLIVKRFIQQDPRGARGLIGWEVQDNLETADFSLLVDKVLVTRFHTE